MRGMVGVSMVAACFWLIQEWAADYADPRQRPAVKALSTWLVFPALDDRSIKSAEVTDFPPWGNWKSNKCHESPWAWNSQTAVIYGANAGTLTKLGLPRSWGAWPQSALSGVHPSQLTRLTHVRFWEKWKTSKDIASIDRLASFISATDGKLEMVYAGSARDGCVYYDACWRLKYAALRRFQHEQDLAECNSVECNREKQRSYLLNEQAEWQYFVSEQARWAGVHGVKILSNTVPDTVRPWRRLVHSCVQSR